MRWCVGALVLLVFSTVPFEQGFTADGWRKVGDGIHYQKVIIKPTDTSIGGIVHAIRIDTKKYYLAPVISKEIGKLNADVKTMADVSGAIIVVNGGFFTPEYESLGLIIKNGQTVNKLKEISWWHIFQLKSDIPQIVTKSEFQVMPEMPDIMMAIQTGPRLVIGGVIPKLKPSVAERSAIGITVDNEVIIAVTEAAPLSLTDFAAHIKELGCFNAINLDGGSSSQIYAKTKEFELNRLGLSFIANGIGVFLK